jgi:hypothetical protein
MKMALSYNREYDRILDDLSRAIETVPRFYEMFEMDGDEWSELSKEEREVCVRTLADDVFYALGSEPSAEIGEGTAEYDGARRVIKIVAGPQLVHVIPLLES